MLLRQDNSQDRRPFEVAPEGAHNAVCYRVVDLGTHKVIGTYALDEQGHQRHQRKLSVYFEIGEPMSDGRPFMVFETYTASFGDKSNLRRFVKGWLGGDPGEEFDTDTLVGRPALLNLAHHASSQGRTFVNIVNAMPIPKGMTPLKPTNEMFAFNIAKPFDQERFDQMSEWVRKTIRESKEYRKIFAHPDEPLDDEPLDDEPQGAPSPVIDASLPF